MEIELGVQPNCSDATMRLITDNLTKREIARIESVLESLADVGDQLGWHEDKLKGTHGIVMSGNMVYNQSGEVITRIEHVVNHELEYDSREDELNYGCKYVNQDEENDSPITCYECEAVYCPHDRPLPDDAVEVGWKKCPKCGRALYFLTNESRWRCIWKPCGVNRKASASTAARVLAEQLKGELEIPKEV